MEARAEFERMEGHRHEPTVHSHVTHNYNQRAMTFDHLSSEHAHDHDHGEPVKERRPRKAAAARGTKTGSGSTSKSARPG